MCSLFKSGRVLVGKAAFTGILPNSTSYLLFQFLVAAIDGSHDHALLAAAVSTFLVTTFH